MENELMKAFRLALQYFVSKKWGAQTRLAETIGISQALINSMTLGKRKGSEELRREIAAYFGYGYEAFLDIGREIIKSDTKKPSVPDIKNKDGILPENIEEILKKLLVICKYEEEKIEYISAVIDITYNRIKKKNRKL
ncbi:MAG: helix-turn-helix domain-containing protein [Desulfarculales bacterium]|jgi:transcriptional regulator with XRE-family HTH domain|nr:helix-turn-helix domain-containing protein [Desulfarculales bacterium]